MQLPKIRAVITDWDETITEKDTIQLVAEAAYDTKPEFPKRWDYFCDVYYSNYKQFIKDFGEKCTLEDEIRYQSGLKEIEMSSVRQYVADELFKDVHHVTFVKQADKVKVKPGFFDVFQKLYDLKIPVYVLSCNWTSIIMEKVFNDHGFTANENLKFVSNEFEHENGVLTGKVDDCRCIRTGVDKVKEVKQILDELKRKGIVDGIYYFGDSTTDVLPMLEVDYGIVLDNGSALKTLDQLKIAYNNGLEGDAKFKHITQWIEINELV